jgi:hypothetical protein
LKPLNDSIRCYATISSTFKPRSLAISSAERSLLNPSIVALARL